MADDATRRAWPPSPAVLVSVAVVAAAIGVFSTWTTDGPVTLNGTQGPNNGWLVLLAGAFALGWARSLARGSWLGVSAVLGAATVIGWTAVENWLDNRDVFDAGASSGLLLVLAASIVLAGSAVSRGVVRARRRPADVPGNQ